MNRTKHDSGDTVDHGQYAKTHKQLSSGAWNKMQAPKYDESSEQPTPEQLMLREAAKRLTAKQRQVWDMFNYDRLTHDQIAAKFKVSRVAITKQIATIEKRIAKWVKSNLGAYKLLKKEYE